MHVGHSVNTERLELVLPLWCSSKPRILPDDVHVDIRSTCKQSWLICLPNHRCHHCAVMGYYWCFLHSNYGKRSFIASDVWMWARFTDATLRPWQKHTHTMSVTLCLQQQLLGTRWKVRRGKREDVHIAKPVWVVNVFMAATISNTPYFLLSNQYMSKPTHDYYYYIPSWYLWFLKCTAENWQYTLLIYFAADHQ